MFAQLVVWNRIIQHERTHLFQHFDGAAPRFFRGAQQFFVAFSCFVVDRSDELVLHLDNAVRHFSSRSLQETDHNSVSLRGGETAQIPNAVSISPTGKHPAGRRMDFCQRGPGRQPKRADITKLVQQGKE